MTDFSGTTRDDTTRLAVCRKIMAVHHQEHVKRMWRECSGVCVCVCVCVGGGGGGKILCVKRGGGRQFVLLTV